VLQTSSFSQTHVLVASNSISLFLLEGENICTYFIKSVASSDYFIKSIASSRCVEDNPGDTLVHKLALARSLGVSKTQMRQEVKQFRVCR